MDRPVTNMSWPRAYAACVGGALRRPRGDTLRSLRRSQARSRGMIERIVSRGFRGRGRNPALAARTPPGQYLTDDFPVLSAGPTPKTPLERWTFTLEGEVEPVKRWTWDAFRQLPS